MKRSYKLLSNYLDQKDLPTHKPPIIDYSTAQKLQDIDEPYNLLDLIHEQRKASGCRLLSARNYSDVSALLGSLDWCKQVVIVCDFASKIAVINTLYIKRILQLLRLLSEDYPHIEFVLSCSEEHVNIFIPILQSLYGEVIP